ncbi:hypothetical protein HDU76_002018, partial [Blyttiomyces sp. JEL0837]
MSFSPATDLGCYQHPPQPFVYVSDAISLTLTGCAETCYRNAQNPKYLALHYYTSKQNPVCYCLNDQDFMSWTKTNGNGCGSCQYMNGDQGLRCGIDSSGDLEMYSIPVPRAPSVTEPPPISVTTTDAVVSQTVVVFSTST